MSAGASFCAGHNNGAEECEGRLSKPNQYLLHAAYYKMGDQPYEGKHSKPVVNPKQLLNVNLDEASQAHGEPGQDEKHNGSCFNLRTTILDGHSEIINRSKNDFKVGNGTHNVF
jgi:hypothetical protein